MGKDFPFIAGSSRETIRKEADVYARSILTEIGTRVLVLSTKRADKENAMVSAREDINASHNIENRYYDKEITLYTPWQEVKKLLQNRQLEATA